MKTLEELVRQFADNVMAQKLALKEGTTTAGNRCAKKRIRAWEQLRARGNEGRDALAQLLDDERPDVRAMVAACLLKYRTKEAKRVLKEVAKGEGLAAFGASEALERWKEGSRIVFAQKRSRKEQGIRGIGFKIFHKAFSWISDFPIPPNSGIFGLIDRQAANELKRFTEKNRFFPGLRSWVGFDQSVVYYDREDRAAGKPKQTFKRLIRYAFDAVFSFSYKPLRIMTGLGICISLIGFLLAIFYVVKRLTGIEITQTGFTTLVTLVLFLGGIQLIAIGLLGEYLARIYDEVKQRPLFIIKNDAFEIISKWSKNIT